MVTINALIRHTPTRLLHSYFEQARIALPIAVNWNGPEPDVVLPLLKAIDELDEVPRARLQHDTERVSALSDEGAAP
jgi:hypothetical protein